jgi:hypothetical protein
MAFGSQRLDLSFIHWGIRVAKRSNTVVPNAPMFVRYWSRVRLSRRGRVDAAKYSNFQDTTATHTINEIEANAKSGQLRVNEWLAREIEPLRAGNKALLNRVVQLDKRIVTIDANPGETGRIRKANRILVLQLKEQRLNLLAQYAANMSAGQRAVEVAVEANDSWRRHFQAQAAIYVRARSLKSKGRIPASTAATPSITSIQVLEIEDFFDQQPTSDKGK